VLGERILVAIDFSELSDQAFAYAVELAERLSAQLVLVHVFQVPAYLFPDAVVAAPQQTVVELERAVERRLEELRARAMARGVAAYVHVPVGSAFVEIIRAARDHKADLIVLGTHGRTGLRHALLGSVAEKVVRKAPCPVLVVRSRGDGRAFVLP
jgi:nucleotide-binding universal stress UspA family protein